MSVDQADRAFTAATILTTHAWTQAVDVVFTRIIADPARTYAALQAVNVGGANLRLVADSSLVTDLITRTACLLTARQAASISTDLLWTTLRCVCAASRSTAVAVLST